jgi:hypothetical protein
MVEGRRARKKDVAGPRSTWFSAANRIAGLLIVLFGWVIFLVMQAFPDPADPPGFLFPFLIATALSIPSWILFVQPQLSADSCGVSIRNPVKEISVPWSHVRAFDGNGKYLVVKTASKDYKAFGLEAFNISLLLRRQDKNQKVADELTAILERQQDRLSCDVDGSIVERIRLPSRAVFAAFGCAIIVGWLLNAIRH